MTSVEMSAPAPGGSARAATIAKWGSVLVLVVSLILMARALPLDTGIDRLKRWVDGFGVWGPFVMGLLYAAGALLFVPGLALTIAAGAVFGLLVGTVTVSVASTTAAALAFLIARYVARNKVAKLARRQPRFGAVDRAISDSGWKIVALLRLVPLFPYSAGNYIFGLTGVRFWPYVLASWLFMLPGTFLYVYVGYIGTESLAAASEADASVDWVSLALKILGFAAAAVAVVYLTRKAKRAIDEQTELDVEAAAEARQQEPAEAKGWSLGTVLLVVVALVGAGGAAWAHLNSDKLAGLFGPPVVRAQEAYAASAGSTRFDHSAFDRLLAEHVDDRGMVDYRALRDDPKALDGYIAAIGAAPFDQLGRDAKLALLINAYNAFTLRLILDHYPVESIKEIPADRRWDAKRWTIGGRTLSLQQIEHHEIRPNFVEPRIHFALVCAAVGCPKLRDEAYVAERLDAQLEDQARYTHEHERWFRFDRDAGVVELTALYDWYARDFEAVADSVLDYAAQWVPELERALEAGRELQVEYLEYDWSLNEAR